MLRPASRRAFLTLLGLAGSGAVQPGRGGPAGVGPVRDARCADAHGHPRRRPRPPAGDHAECGRRHLVRHLGPAQGAEGPAGGVPGLRRRGRCSGSRSRTACAITPAASDGSATRCGCRSPSTAAPRPASCRAATRTTLAVRSSFPVADHIGAVAADLGALIGCNWDARSVLRVDARRQAVPRRRARRLGAVPGSPLDAGRICWRAD